MAYKISVSQRAQREIDHAVGYYALYSTDVPVNFIAALKETYATLEMNPFFEIRYKNVRSLKIRRFPHSLFFVINENRILSCFHNKQSPNKKPRHEQPFVHS